MLAVATMFGQVIVRTKLPQALVTLITNYVDNRTVFIFLVVVLIVFLGMLMDGAVLLRADRGILPADCHVAATSDGIRIKILNNPKAVKISPAASVFSGRRRGG